MDIFLAITQYDGLVHGKCAKSILENSVNLMQDGHLIKTHYDNDLYIDRSRNECASLFLQTDSEEMVFIDSDLAFDPDAIQKLIKHDKELVCGAYPLKQDETVYPVVIDYDSHGGNCKDEETGLVYVISAPTGLMKIRRSVLENMIKHYDMKPDDRGLYQFFETGTRVFNDGQWWGEDTAFCKKYRDMGGTIYVDPTICFTHTGRKDYHGNFHEYLMGRRVDQMDKVDSGILGWMKDNELALLRYLSSRCDDVIEIGCWKGRSTQAFLESCKGPVYAVDHWNGTDTDASSLATCGLDIYDEFMKNVGDCPNLKVCRGDSADVVKDFKGKADMVFIDAGHTYAEVKADIERWLPHCGKIIAGHDWCDEYPGVAQAVGELIGDVHVIDTIWFKEL